MPVTRSQRDVSQHSTGSEDRRTDGSGARPRTRGATSSEETLTSEATTGTTTTGGTNTSSETTTSGTATTAGTKAAITSAPEEPKGGTVKEKADQRAPAPKSKLASSSRRARSIRTTSSATRRRELEAQEELARLELEQAQAATRLARTRLELARCEEENDDSVDEDPEDRTAQVQDWIQESMKSTKNNEQVEQRGPDPSVPTEVKTEERNNMTVDVRILADALKAAFTHREGPVSQPNYIHELPLFDGNSGEWIAFKTVYEETSKLFSDVQNMARLRRAIRGTARDAIKSLLYSEASPTEVVQALRRRFGRSDALILAELEKIKALSRITDNPRDICTFASQINNSVAAVKGLKKPHYLHSPEMVRQVVEKMPSILKFRWYDFTANSEDGEFSSLLLISEFLNREADRCGAFATLETVKPHHEERRKIGNRHVANMAAEVPSRAQRDTKQQYLNRSGGGQVTGQGNRSSRDSCSFCQSSHLLINCSQFSKLPVEDRWAHAKKTGLCFKCLSDRHRKIACRRPGCKVCGRWHHQLLHSERDGAAHTKPAAEVEGTTTNLASPVCAVKAARAYLKMAPVEVYGPKGSMKVIALLDEGSTVSLMDSQVAAQIGATGRTEELVLETVGGQLLRKRDSQRLRVRIRGLHHDRVRNLNRVHTIDRLKLTPQFVDRRTIEACPHLEEMADVLSYGAEAPRLLVGQDNWELIVSQDVRKGRSGQPVASLTELGWVLHGYDARGAKPVHFINSCMNISSMDDDMHELIKQHFSIDSLGIQQKRPSTDSEGRALAILEDTCRRTKDGRFEVGLLWKSENERMPESYTAAERRLRGTEKKLDKDSVLRDEYSKQIQHLIDCGYAEEAPEKAEQGREWYLPHFAVTHPLKKKVRLVFDAAAKSCGKSLNDALLPGPDLLQSLFGVLLRFRQGPVAVAADIKEMFLQVRIRTSDRDSLRFLWRGDRRDLSPKVYRMTSVIFGATSSPCSAIYVKNRNAADFSSEYPEASRAVERNHYMDDYLHSFHSGEDLIKISKQVDSIHRKAGFELRGWASNDTSLLREVCSEKIEATEVPIADTEEKTLGLRWKTETDCLSFRADLRNTPNEVIQGYRTPTKREVTSAVMSTFDPLGLATPILIQGKKLIQNIWRSGVGWDDAIEAREDNAWRSYLSNVVTLSSLDIPRCIAPHCTEGELHVFVDASELAYAAVVYWRTSDGDGGYRIGLVASKARVTPLKPVSVPRLELQAALLGSRLARSITVELDLKVTGRTFWSDSSVVLSWIKTDPRTFKTFVAHRLAEIEDLTQPQEWRWIPTALNPADDATRDVPTNFTNEHRWYTGPEFLQQSEEHWPAPRTFKRESTEELKEEVKTAAATLVNFESPDPSRFSSWVRLWRTTARVIQFIDLCKARKSVNTSVRHSKQDPTWGKVIKKKASVTKYTSQSSVTKFSPLNNDQLIRAETYLLQLSQRSSFNVEILCLRRGKPLERSSKLKKLDVELQEGLLRLRGRIDAIRGVTTEYKRPVVLDSKNKITRLIIDHYHRRFNHGNAATVMNELRQRYLIIGLRSALRAIQHACQWCRVRKATPAEVPQGDLPAERLHHGSPPFTCTGVDYFGPMVVTVGRRHEKRWGALFTCLTTRAVHIELAASLSADSMLLALRRFAARRGMPRVIYSDNGTNFIGANTELKTTWADLKQEELTCEADKLGVRWKFIPPGAPNMGGAWERLVRSVKTALHATLKERHPREEVLLTLLLEAEHVVNSRPLTNLADNTEEEALTPNHFLIGRSCGAPRVGAFDDGELVGRETWRTAQRLADHFWRRWLREYLPTLLPRKTDGRAGPADLKAGDVVLVVDSTLPRCTWPRGRVTATYPGPDGRTRIVDVETKGGVLRRPSSRVVLLVPGESPSPGGGAEHEGENVGDPSQ